MIVVYMVAGLSSRFGGKIKQFAKVTDTETLIEYSMNEAIKAGAKKFVFIVGTLTETPFKEKFGTNYNGLPIDYALQKFDSAERDKPWGTVDALVSAKNVLDTGFIVCNGDDLYGANNFKILFDHLKKSSEDASVGYQLEKVVPETGSVNRGLYKTSEDYVMSIDETFGITKSDLEKYPNYLCSMNFFALHPETVLLLEAQLDKFKTENKGNRKVECLLPVEISNLIAKGKIKLKLYPANGDWLGITNPDDEFIVREIIKTRK